MYDRRSILVCEIASEICSRMARIFAGVPVMTGETAREISTNSEVLKRPAKYLAQQCFRNTILEDLHAGITADSQIGDYTDVVVRSPYGEIPWPNLSRLNDDGGEAYDQCREPDRGGSFKLER